VEDTNYRTALNLLISSLSSPSLPRGSTVHHQHILTLGATPPLLIAHGMPDLLLAVNGRVIDKCFFDHGIQKSMLERMYSMICTPKAIYKPSNQEPGCVVMSFEIKNGNPIILSIRSNHQMGGRRNYYNAVTSMYDKGGNAEIRWNNQGLLLWTS
jgi:Phage MuF-C-terminal domain